MTSNRARDLWEFIERIPRKAHRRVVVTYFQGPRSYTADDVVEISGTVRRSFLRHIVEIALSGGARLGRTR